MISPSLPSCVLPTLSARDFIQKWGAAGTAQHLNERAGAQAHFIDLCRLLGVAEPDDPQRYCFERGVAKTGSAADSSPSRSEPRTNGFADVWLKNHFAWEYKAPGKSLDGALKQLMMYALPLDNPPLLVVSDRLRIEIHSHFTGTPSERHVITLDDLARPDAQHTLRALWADPDHFKPRRSNRQITEDAARTFAATAERLRAAGAPAGQVSHFLTQCVFCFFAEDVGLLPERLFERLVGVNVSPERLRVQLDALLATMRDGGLFGVDDIAWFSGGLFQAVAVPPLALADVAALKAASALNWAAIDPSIFGTLFERGLDPAVRSQLGANYTDPATINRVITPVIARPLLAEWAALLPGLRAALARSKKHGDKAYRDAQALFVGFLERLKNFRVLDPACGSGNFLYLALKCLKDIEHQANLEAEALGLQRQIDVTGPHNVLGLEINEYAAELARITVWIGELQWRLQRGYGFKLNPVLAPLDHIETRDAVLGADGVEAVWPDADVVVGNPPFVGDKKMRAELGDDYTTRLRAAYAGRVPGGADLVCYWFEKARAMVQAGRVQRVGLVATNSIRQGANRQVLRRVRDSVRIFEAWADEPWVNHGAAVRVSLVMFGNSAQPSRLDGDDVTSIFADLSAQADGSAAMDLTTAAALRQNDSASFFGFCLAGPFVVDAGQARAWLQLPNPNGRSNADVLSPIWNGADVTRRAADRWTVDFGAEMSVDDAALYEQPFAHALREVHPIRMANQRASRSRYWWRHGETRPGLRRAGANAARWIVTSETAKHRCFVWLPGGVAPEHKLVVIPREDDVTLGVLSSRAHLLWASHLGSTLEDRPVYTTSACFATFPFPAGLTPADTAHQRTEALPGGALVPADLAPETRARSTPIAQAAKRLTDLRDAWLNPPEWCQRVAEVTPLGRATSPYPDRIVARPGHEKALAQRTLTQLYNQRPTWLAQAHAALDAAVAAAYGWPGPAADLPDDDILRRLLALNRQRSA